jgi:hypothetical protein
MKNPFLSFVFGNKLMINHVQIRVMFVLFSHSKENILTLLFIRQNKHFGINVEYQRTSGGELP